MELAHNHHPDPVEESVASCSVCSKTRDPIQCDAFRKNHRWGKHPSVEWYTVSRQVPLCPALTFRGRLVADADRSGYDRRCHSGDLKRRVRPVEKLLPSIGESGVGEMTNGEAAGNAKAGGGRRVFLFVCFIAL